MTFEIGQSCKDGGRAAFRQCFWLRQIVVGFCFLQVLCRGRLLFPSVAAPSGGGACDGQRQWATVAAVVWES